MLFRAKMADQDMSLIDAAQDFMDKIMEKEKPVYRDVLYWFLFNYGNEYGTESDEISARQYQ